MTWWLVLAGILVVGLVDLWALALCRIAKKSDE